VVTERQLVDDGTSGQIVHAIEVWRAGAGGLLEAAFVLARPTGDPSHVHRQLRALRHLLEALLRPRA
jgi:TetR/AcrR family transcriptional repressor of nem operon